MRPLPRLHAITDANVVGQDDFGVRAAALASIGPAVALHARLRAAPVNQLIALTTRLLAHAGPPEASVFVNARPDVARALDAQGVQLGTADLSASDARRSLGDAQIWVGRSVHSAEQARSARDEGADFLMLGQIFETPSHAGHQPVGLATLEEVAGLGLPVIAIGGIDGDRATLAREAGAWGVAAIRAVWQSPDSAVAGLRLLAPWLGEGAS